MADTIRTDRVRLLMLIKKKEGLTREEFSDYWRNVHAKLFMKLDIVKTNCLRYEQVKGHTDSKWATVLTDSGLPTSDYDGVLMLDGESFEKLFEIFRSEEFLRNVAPDEENFVDRPNCGAYTVHSNSIFEHAVIGHVASTK
ncbi:hypothetical protein DXG01_016171 [Tephrocybe rancida]|nr:hypothetical protein DXG01_016171 [Tephrocybe rancida]